MSFGNSDAIRHSLIVVHGKAFARELHILAKLNQHPNVVKLHGFILEGAFPSIVLEWAVHGTVIQYIKGNAVLDRIPIVGFVIFPYLTRRLISPSKVRGITRGLEYLHQNDAIHSDLRGVSNDDSAVSSTSHCWYSGQYLG